MLRSRWYAIKPMGGMVGTGAPAFRSISVPQGLEFAANRLVQVHTTGNDGTEWPMGPTGVSTG